MKWEKPPPIKIYEALGAVADGRIEVTGNTAKVYSSSGNKFYDVEHDAASASIMTNDNGSYWKGYLGYPAIAYLLSTRVLPYKEQLANLLRGIAWKDINTTFKNDFDKTLVYIYEQIPSTSTEKLQTYVNELQSAISELSLNKLGKRKKPPTGY